MILLAMSKPKVPDVFAKYLNAVRVFAFARLPAHFLNATYETKWHVNRER